MQLGEANNAKSNYSEHPSIKISHIFFIKGKNIVHILISKAVFSVPQALPAGGIHIFASQLHTHLAGLGVRTVLVRGGREVEVVQEDKHFSTHYQVLPHLSWVVKFKFQYLFLVLLCMMHNNYTFETTFFFLLICKPSYFSASPL